MAVSTNFLVGFHEQKLPNLIVAYEGEIIHQFQFINALACRLPVNAAQELARHKQVRYVEPDDMVFALQRIIPWGVSRVFSTEQFPFATWEVSKGERKIAAILDTGVEEAHPNIPQLKGAVNTIDNTPPDTDQNGHGTHVAGTVAALNRDIGVVGVAPRADLLSVKVLNQSGRGTIRSLVEGLEWAIMKKADIMNMSLGLVRCSQTLQEICKKANQRGHLLIAAAGNRGMENHRNSEVTYPAAFPSVVAVSASNLQNERPTWSSQGDEVELIAPGVEIISTIPPDGYAYRSGTSMAAPHTSGTAALAWVAAPELSNYTIRKILQNTAQDLSLLPSEQGFGLVRSDRATKTAANYCK